MQNKLNDSVGTADEAQHAQQAAGNAILANGLSQEIAAKGFEGDQFYRIASGIAQTGAKLSVPFSHIEASIMTYDPRSFPHIFAALDISESDRLACAKMAQTLMGNNDQPRAIALLSAIGEVAKVSEYIDQTITRNPFKAEEAILLAYKRNPTPEEWGKIAKVFIDNVVLGQNEAKIQYPCAHIQDPDEHGFETLRIAFDLLKKANSEDGTIWANIATKYLQFYKNVKAGEKSDKRINIQGYDLDHIAFALSKATLPVDVKRDMKRSLAEYYTKDARVYEHDKVRVYFTRGLELLHQIGEFDAAKGRDMAERIHEGSVEKVAWNLDKILAALTFSPDGPVAPKNIEVVRKLGFDLLQQAQAYLGTNYILSNIYTGGARTAFETVLKHDKHDTEGFEAMAKMLWNRALTHRRLPEGPSYDNAIVGYILHLCQHAGIVFPDPALYQWIIDLNMSSPAPRFNDLTAAFKNLALSAAMLDAERAALQTNLEVTNRARQARASRQEAPELIMPKKD